MCALLTIVIPTWNRAALLNNTLEKLSNQITLNSLFNVEVLVTDNASTDKTELVVANFSQSNPKIKVVYTKNKENLGFDGNCLKGAEIASGKFIWFLSDDDELFDEAVLKVYNALKSNENIVFAFANYAMITPGFTIYYPCKYDSSINLVVDSEELIEKTRLAFSFIGSCIFNRNEFLSINLTPYLGSYWLQLYAVKLVSQKGVSLIIVDPIVKMLRGELQETRNGAKHLRKKVKIDGFMDVHLAYIKYANSFDLCEYNKKTINFIKNSAWRDNFKQIISMKVCSEIYDLQEISIIFSSMAKFYYRKPLFWLLHVPVLLMPKMASEFIHFMMLKWVKFKLKFGPILRQRGLIKETLIS